ncbi:hypothetical protein PTSG_01081 [Salpingoeca rosetta]|uniref:Uncharacterized protein n=1 Tax=Salpingoeca rosetta (strain ATCC 50818 / BSB-021) TaxID=946362 RepID=F2TYC2_SALR5|nr:uncharacterized protein PTSG_01081 [Salpingoeca rosetta]EGD76381.1 hypothetical protein PTSG_01081 [Salpingoeca rosetta]|eukprot:XP_004998556.1 hypothetical protein PTSG_01081 [Salpingoeca rosetta]
MWATGRVPPRSFRPPARVRRPLAMDAMQTEALPIQQPHQHPSHQQQQQREQQDVIVPETPPELQPQTVDQLDMQQEDVLLNHDDITDLCKSYIGPPLHRLSPILGEDDDDDDDKDVNDEDDDVNEQEEDNGGDEGSSMGAAVAPNTPSNADTQQRRAPPLARSK